MNMTTDMGQQMLSTEESGKAVSHVSLKEDFQAWMIKQNSESGELFSPKTVDTYTVAIKNYTKKLNLGDDVHSDLFLYTSANEFEVAHQKILAAPNSKEIDIAHGNGAYFNGMKQYARFLKERESDECASVVDTHKVEIIGKRRYWCYNPTVNWEICHANSIILLSSTQFDWNQLGDARLYSQRSDVISAMKNKYSNEYNYKNNSLAFWQFANKINKGDVIFVIRGRQTFIARGIVESDYVYDQNGYDCFHVRRVKWTHIGEWEHAGLSTKTLTDITPYSHHVEKLEMQIVGEPPEICDGFIYHNYLESDFLNEVYLTKERYDVLKGLLLRKKNVILQGAPGVGKTFAAQRLAFSIMGEKDTDRVKIIQFHQSYSYEDFVMGYRPNGNGFSLADGPFYKFCKIAEEDDERSYFFIIDEINRGNLSKIFGELLMLIESDKRGEKNALRLLYKDEQFSVPENLHIIGMMNTADRSLAMIDYALRRRFAFFDMEPAFSSDGFKARQTAIQNLKFDALIKVVQDLNKDIVGDESLGVGFRVGHSYFCTNDIVDDAWLSSVVEYELIPLLNEYWFDEPSKIKHWSERLRSVVNG